MGKQIGVSSFEEMAQAAKKLRVLADTYMEIAQQLLQEANNMGAAWEGADNVAFVDQINGFTEELKSMSQKLSLASEALEKQRANYVERQDSNITQVKKLTN